MKILKRIISLPLSAALLLLCLAGCGSSGSPAPQDSTPESAPVSAAAQDAQDAQDTQDAPAAEDASPVLDAEPTPDDSAQTEFSVGETWVVDGQWELTVTGVTETDERNQFSDKEPAAVYLIDYVYVNTGYVDDDGIMDGLYISLDSGIVDNSGVMGYSYPNTPTNFPKETPVGAACKAQAFVGVDNSGAFSVNISIYDSNNNKQAATFLCDPEAAPVEIDVSTSGPSAENALAIGDTWTVDGQWELTITGVSETDERNEYSDKAPAAVYIVDYTYSNTGYVDEDGIMDGLYIDIADSIVDSTGSMGYSYPGSIANYPDETPVGATCNAQACIGVDNAGSFQITVTKYDGANNKQSATFFVDVP